MERKYGKTAWAVISFVLLLLVVGVFLVIAGRFSGRLSTVEIPSDVTAKVDVIEMVFADTCFLRLEKQTDGGWYGKSGHIGFEADEGRIEDFLSLFNTWEVLMIPTDAQRASWKREMDERGGRISLKKGGRRLFSASFIHVDGYFVIDRGRHKVYAMDMPYNPNDCRHFFEADPMLWKNRLLFYFDYTSLAFVKVDFPQEEDSYRLLNKGQIFLLEHAWGMDTVRTSRAQAYFSSFSRVYFDFKEEECRVGRLLYKMEICPRMGDRMLFSVFEKLTGDTPDVFKALVMVPRLSGMDTVELPYVVLDKLVKRPSWFRR